MPNEPQAFTWHQRGAIDRILGIPFSESPAPDLFERDEWEKGWLAQDEYEQKLLVRIAATAADRVCKIMQRK